MTHCSGVWAQPRESACWKTCCWMRGGICALGSVLLPFLQPQDSAVPPGLSGSKVVLVFRCGSPGGLCPASPFLRQCPSHPVFSQCLGGRWEEVKVTWAPGTLPTGWWPIERPFCYRQIRTREGKRLAGGHPAKTMAQQKQHFWPKAVCAAQARPCCIPRRINI